MRSNGDIAFIGGKDKLSDAIEFYTRAIQLNPNDHQSFSNRYAAYHRIGDATSALNDARSILMIEPFCPRSYFNRGSALISLQQYEEAFLVFGNGLAKYPNDQALLHAFKDTQESMASFGNQTHNVALDARISSKQEAVEEERVNVEGTGRVESRSGVEKIEQIPTGQDFSITQNKRNQIERGMLFNADPDNKPSLSGPHLADSNEPKCLEGQKLEEHLPSEETVDENLDMLGQLVNMAEAGRNLQFVPAKANFLACDLHLNDPMNASGLTLDSYFRRDDSRTNRMEECTVSLSENRPKIPTEKLREFDAMRLRLNAIVECMDQGPIQLPPRYIDMIKTETVLGCGYYGEVRLGIDEPIGKRFAIKLIKPLVIEQALANRLVSVQQSFKNEIQVSAMTVHLLS